MDHIYTMVIAGVVLLAGIGLLFLAAYFTDKRDRKLEQEILSVLNRDEMMSVGKIQEEVNRRRRISTNPSSQVTYGVLSVNLKRLESNGRVERLQYLGRQGAKIQFRLTKGSVAELRLIQKRA